MKQIKVISIFGTRPEAIKMAPLVKELEKRKEIKSIVVVTAQHRQMLDSVLETFNIKPDYDLNIMKQGQTLGDITTRALTGLEEVIKKEKPDIVLVHGDTTTTFAGALAAFYNSVSIGHVEAGLRTYDKYSPYPEEMNRQMVDCMSDMYFAPTELSKSNLLKQNIEESKIYVTGNTAIDAMKTTVDKDYNNEVGYYNITISESNPKIVLTVKTKNYYKEKIDNNAKIEKIEILEYKISSLENGTSLTNEENDAKYNTINGEGATKAQMLIKDMFEKDYIDYYKKANNITKLHKVADTKNTEIHNALKLHLLDELSMFISQLNNIVDYDAGTGTYKLKTDTKGLFKQANFELKLDPDLRDDIISGLLPF